MHNNEVDRLPDGMKKQPAPNIAFGRKSDGNNEWGYQLTPTPGAANNSEVCAANHILPDPVFSTAGRVTTDGKSYTLTISLPKDAPEGTTIRYTTDCSEPTLQKGIPYTSPITIDGTRIIRARLFCNGWLSPRSVTHSHITFQRQLTLPVVSIVTDNSYLYDSRKGIYVSGSYNSKKKNYEYNWRRPINIELFENEDEESQLNQLCETRIAGAASRGHALKSLAVYANKRFGTKRLQYEFFPDQRPEQTDYKSILLRNAGNDFDYLYMRDAIIQRTMGQNVDIDWQAWRPVIFYMNGEYKGILNIRERSNEDNIYTNYDGLEEIDMVENWWDLKQGTMDNWNTFTSFYNEHGHSYYDYDQLMDVSEFMNIMIMNLFFCNVDFPGNNFTMWRPQADKGRWRVVAKDTDYALGIYDMPYDYKVLKWINNPAYDGGHSWANQFEHTRLFRRLMEDRQFHDEFIERFIIYMGDFLNYSRIWEIWKPMYDAISYEYPFHRQLYNRWWPNYGQELDKAKQWLMKRVSEMQSQIVEYYATPALRPLVVNTSLSEETLADMDVTMNGIALTRSTFNGKYFVGRKMTLHATGVNGWEVSEIMSDGPHKSVYEGDTYTFTMPDCYALTITAITNNGNSINGTPSTQPSSTSIIYDLSGRRSNTSGIKVTKGRKFINNR